MLRVLDPARTHARAVVGISHLAATSTAGALGRDVAGRPAVDPGLIWFGRWSSVGLALDKRWP
jgi:hypothetical protein